MPPKVKATKVDETFTDGVQDETMLEFIKSKLIRSFVDNIPLEAIRELPGSYMFVFGSIAYVVSTCIFLYFILTGFKRNIRTEFISLDDGDGVCQDVSKEVTGTYYGTSDGKWSGDADFALSRALYKLDFVNYDRNEKNYRKRTMATIKEDLDRLARRSYTRDAAGNLMEWMTWEIYDATYVSYYAVRALPIPLPSPALLCNHHSSSFCIALRSSSSRGIPSTSLTRSIRSAAWRELRGSAVCPRTLSWMWQMQCCQSAMTMASTSPTRSAPPR